MGFFAIKDNSSDTLVKSSKTRMGKFNAFAIRVTTN